MAIIYCPECGKEILLNNVNICSGCGYPLTEHLKTQTPKLNDIKMNEESRGMHNNPKTKNYERIQKVLILTGVITFIIGSIFLWSGFNKKNNYYNSEYSSYGTNTYVGGDAYNYIINANYFTGYITLAAGMYIITAITEMGALGVYIVTSENKKN